MGLFGGSKTIHVSSSVYNMAGDEANRPNFLKSSLFSAVMNPYDVYLGEVIVGNYLKGPGIMQRSFFNWAVRNDIAGLPTFSVRNTLSVDPEIIKPFIPLPGLPVGLETNVQSSEISDGDFNFWAEKFVLENFPEENGSEWICDYNEGTHEITVQFVSGVSHIFDATNFNKNKQYLIARFYQSVPSSVQPLITGTTTLNSLSFPSVSGYTLDSTVNTGIVNHTLNQTVEVTKVYSDGSPTTVDTTYPTTVVGYNGTEKIYGKTDYVGGDGVSSETSNVEKFYHLFEFREVTVNATGVDEVVVNDLGGGETETVTTHTSGDFLTPIYDYREDTQETVLEAVVGDAQIYIYEMGTGEPILDALQVDIPTTGIPEYYPFIPIRLNNKSILHVDYSSTGSGLYPESKTAYRKASKNQSLLAVVEQVEDNPDLGDIDYSYIQWGVSVNVIEPACRRYMYEFFKNLMTYQTTSSATIVALKANVAAYQAGITALQAWTIAQEDQFDPLYGTAKPVVESLVDPKSSTVRLNSNDSQLGGFDNRYTWVTVEEGLFTGLGKPEAVVGELWFETGEKFTWNVYSGLSQIIGGSFSSVPRTLDQMYLYKQTGTNTYSRLSIWGMVHNNYIYGGKSVRTTLEAGVNSLTPSVFIIPLHAPTVKSLGIKDFTQMATANTWITFNSYLVVKKKWYETFLGQLFLIIAIVVISALLSPASVGAATGIFGTNAAVGASLGLSGTAGIVAGAVTNAIAAIVIAQAISSISVAIFGEKWGAIISAIVNFAVSFGIANGFSNMSLSSMMTPQNILQFSSALANGYSGFVQANIGEINGEMVENQGVYDKAKADLEALMRSQGLINDLSFNPLSLTDSLKGNGSSRSGGSYVPETLDEFINRTTMTGADVVDVTLSMVSDYSDLQLTLPKG